MKRHILGALAFSLLLGTLAHADVDKAPTVEGLRAQALQIPLTETAETALNDLYTERDTWTTSFDWGTREDLVARQQAFQAGMKGFEVRGHEIMRDMYQSLGYTELAQKEQDAISWKETPASERARVLTERNGIAEEVTTPEASEVAK
ncbi:MAG: hypothetical protein KC488_14205 [Candidatus Cloacimonetes bacterium]|nr:hypothetical protein [Candidatus Cloacimonadota bacterium]